MPASVIRHVSFRVSIVFSVFSVPGNRETGPLYFVLNTVIIYYQFIKFNCIVPLTILKKE